MFGRATITLGIGPHSSSVSFGRDDVNMPLSFMLARRMPPLRGKLCVRYFQPDALISISFATFVCVSVFVFVDEKYTAWKFRR